MAASTYMGLSLPTPSLTVGPAWASMLNSALTTIDAHNHTAGSGQQVPSAGLNINADLPFNGWNLTLARTLRLQQQAAAPALTSDAGCVYVTTAGDLWYNNGAGQHVQITSGSALSAASLGGISGLSGTSAGAAYSAGSGTFAFTSAANTAAILDGGPIVIRDTVASALGITVKSPASLAAAYTLTLPTGLPASTSVLTVSAAGQLAAGPTVASIIDNTWAAAAGCLCGLSVLTSSNPSNWTKATLNVSAATLTTVGTSAPTIDNTNNRIVINKGGTYVVSFTGPFTANAVAGYDVMFFKNGASLYPALFQGQHAVYGSGGGSATIALRMTLTLAATDVIEIDALSPSSVSGLMTFQAASLTIERVA